MITRILACFITAICVIPAYCFNIEIDNSGIMRDGDSGEELSFFGTNYTVPFAHAYRMLNNYPEDEHKRSIDTDVYHMSRLGFNAFRIHIWDVEISDSIGNLIENDHLDLLDYLIYKLEERGIAIVLTAQTNFGNGYPERDINTGGYSYFYEKCKMHDTEESIKAQERYATSLVSHKNKYTGKTYSEDENIIAIEINNEPCHSGDEKQVADYIKRMVKAFRKGGFDKMLLYNVSHNMYCSETFFAADVQGTTYQWYPIGLVAGHERKGNFLPNIDEYNMPFSQIKGYKNKARFVYEFDPADILYSYMYPAMVRSFKSAGFQWMTQFTYDPTILACSNTEYQTHYMNLIYTPKKAISMMIAGEAAKRIKEGEKFPKYPADTLFHDVKCSYRCDLSELNDGKKFYYSNNTNSHPKAFEQLSSIAGCGNSSVVQYSGTGAYFIDKLDDNTWRLEVMPDVIILSDPFQKPSLKKHACEIMAKERIMTLHLPGLNEEFYYVGINDGNNRKGVASNNELSIYPGTYLISNNILDFDQWGKNMTLGNLKLNEYALPGVEKYSSVNTAIEHNPTRIIENGDSLVITSRIFSSATPDSVLIYPSTVSFWIKDNKTYKMQRMGDDIYQAAISKDELQKYGNKFEYNILTFIKEEVKTFPQDIVGSPLDWDFTDYEYYSTQIVEKDSPVILVNADSQLSSIEYYSIPDNAMTRCNYVEKEPLELNVIELEYKPKEDSCALYLRKYIRDLVNDRHSLNEKHTLCVSLSDVSGADSLTVSLLDRNGFTYSKTIRTNGKGIYRIPVEELTQDETALLPAPFPVFLKREFKPDVNLDFDLSDIENIEISTCKMPQNSTAKIGIVGIWLE